MSAQDGVNCLQKRPDEGNAYNHSIDLFVPRAHCCYLSFMGREDPEAYMGIE